MGNTLQQHVAEVMEGIREDQVSLSDVADTLFALGKARYYDTQLLRELAGFVSRNISAATGSDLSKMLSGLAWLNVRDSPIILAAAARIASGAVELDRASIINSASALGRLGYTVSRDEAGAWNYIAGLGKARLIDAPNASEVNRVVTLIWALAKAGWHPGKASEAGRTLPGIG